MQLNINDIPNNTNLYLIKTRDFHSLTETKSYTPITSCVLEYILTTTNLTNHEKLYYLVADSLSLIGKNRGESRSCALPSEDWAERLGCSRSLVFAMQQSLVKKGYFIISKDWDDIGRNKRNLITPTLPASVFNHLNEKFPGKIGEHAPYNRFTECKRSYLDRTKLFIKLNYDLLKIITSNKYLNPMQKIIWLGFYTRCYKNYMLQDKEDSNVGKSSYNNVSSFSFISSYQELADMYSCNTKHLSKSIRALEELGFIKAQNFYIKKKYSDNDDCIIQERQDRSLWKITLSLPNDCILELEKVKNRSNLKLKDITVAVIENTLDPKLIEDCLILGGIKFNLDLEQISLLKSVIVDDNDDGRSGDVNCSGNIDIIPPLPHVPCAELYIDSVIEELNAGDAKNIKDKLKESSRIKDIDFLSNTAKILPTSSSSEIFDNNEEKNDGIKSDPTFAKSVLLLNKDLLLKIKDIKSNLGTSSKVLFDKFLKRFKNSDYPENEQHQKKEKEFNIHSELIREKLKVLPKDKADKARKFAYSLVSKGLASGYAASLSKHELAKQLIHHAATWKPAKLGAISREKEIDTALSVAWKKIVGGTWQVPLELAKAEILQYEFKAYRQKYQELGIISNELGSLESATNKLLKTDFIDLKGKIIEYAGTDVVAVSCNNAIISKTEANDDNDYNALLDHSKNIELPPYLEDQEYYLSYGYCGDPSYMDNGIIAHSDIIDRDEGLISGTEYKGYREVNITGKDEDRQNNYANQILDLSAISEKQKYLRVTCLEKNNEMVIKTVNNTEYLYKLKSMGFNEEGDTIMTLKHVKLKSFIEEANTELFTQSSKAIVTNDLSDNSNCLTANGFSVQNHRSSQIANDTQTDGIVEQRQPERLKLSLNIKSIEREFPETDIDIALSTVLKNLQHKVE